MKIIETSLRSHKGMTLVELIVAIGILAILMVLSVGIFVSQQKAYVSVQDAHENQENVPVAMTLLQQDLMQAGWSVEPDMALYIEDGKDNASDTVYINDVNVIDVEHASNVQIMGDLERRSCPGCVEASGSNPYEIQTLDGSPSLDINEINGSSSETDHEFFDGSFIITNSTTNGVNKVAQISSVDVAAKKIALDKSVGFGTDNYLAPAIYYDVNNGELRRSSSDTYDSSNRADPFPIARNIVDLQVACETDTGWQTDCSSLYDPREIKMLRVTLVTRSDHKVADSTADQYCHPVVENRDARGNCGYRYRTYTVEFCPRNNKET